MPRRALPRKLVGIGITPGVCRNKQAQVNPRVCSASWGAAPSAATGKAETQFLKEKLPSRVLCDGIHHSVSVFQSPQLPRDKKNDVNTQEDMAAPCFEVP